jgi:hypothetical protein
MKILSSFAASFLLVITGCDVVQKDKDIQPTKTTTVSLFATKDKATVIDLQKIFPTMNSANVIAGSGVSYFGDRYVKYSPTAAPTDFSFIVKQTDQSVVQTNVRVQSLSGAAADCSTNQPFTYAKITNQEPLVVNLFNNPEFCAYDPTAPLTNGLANGISLSRSGVDVDQNSDGVTLAICACSGNNTAILTYVPPSGFAGQVKFTYYLFAEGDPLEQNVFYDPKYSKYFSKHDVTIDVTQ